MIRFRPRDVPVAACVGLLALATTAAGDAPVAGQHTPPTAREWSRSLVVNPRTVRVVYSWAGGGPPAEFATVSYRRRTVHITLYQKPVPTGVPIILVSKFACAEFKLAHPLGRRRVVNGVTGRPPPRMRSDTLRSRFDLWLRLGRCAHPPLYDTRRR